MRWQTRRGGGKGQVSAGATHTGPQPTRQSLWVPPAPQGPPLPGPGWRALRDGSFPQALPGGLTGVGSKPHLGPGLADTQGSPSSCHEAEAEEGRGCVQLCPTASRPGQAGSSLSSLSPRTWTEQLALSTAPSLPIHLIYETSTLPCRAAPSKEPLETLLNCPNYLRGRWLGRARGAHVTSTFSGPP